MFDEKAAITRRRLLGMGATVVGASALSALPAAASPDPATVEAGTAAAAACPPVDPGALLPSERIGVQLYTLRDVVASEGFAKVFERLAAIGYAEVEFAGYDERDHRVSSLAELRQLLDDTGLRIAGSHMQSGNIDAEIDKALTLGVPAIGVPSINVIGRTRASWQSQCETWNEWGQRCRDAGLAFYLHNHAPEFGYFLDDDGTLTRHYDAIMAETDPELVLLELDLYWAYMGQAQHGGFDPVDYVVEHPERFTLFHVKDGKESAIPGIPFPFFGVGGYEMVDVGQGDIDFGAFFNALRAADPDLASRSYLLEHDNPGQPHGPWRTACTAYGWMAHGLRVADGAEV